MRIISSFFDYYDKGVAYGIDPKQVYARETKEIDVDYKHPEYNNELMKLSRDMPMLRSISGFEFTKRSGVIAFCGKAYPWYQVGMEYGGNKFNKTYYSIAAMEKDVMGDAFEDNASNRLISKKDYSDRAYMRDAVKHLRSDVEYMIYGPPKMYWASSHAKVVQFDKTSVGKKLPDELFIRHNAPIMLVYNHNDYTFHKNSTLYLNPRLNEFNFITQFDPIAAFQEIAMYLGNNMAKQVDPSTNFSDDLKRDIKGFDKWSFRKHKKDPK